MKRDSGAKATIREITDNPSFGIATSRPRYMHLLKAQPGVVADGSEAVDLGQTPGDIVVLSAADTELASLAAARATLGETFPAVRLANLMQLSHNASVDLYCEAVIAETRLVIVRLLGGKSYWPYGVEQIAETCAATGATLVLLPGDDQPDPELAAHSTADTEAYRRLWSYLLHGGAANSRSFLAFAATLLGRGFEWREPAELPRAGIWWPGLDHPGLADLRRVWAKDRPVAALVFYRALVQADNVAPVRALVEALGRSGVNCLPVYCTSLKDPVSAGVIESLLAESETGVVLNGTGFAVSTPGRPTVDSPLNATGAPVLQVVFSGGNEKEWRAGTRGLSARDIAMNVALPEVDGRILSRAVSFKGEARFDESTQCSLVAYEPVPDRVELVAKLAANWLRLGSTPVDQRRLAVILANYPNRDGRLGNGVGLDTPASVVELLRALEREGYAVADVPRDGDDLVARLRRGPTNAAVDGREISVTLKLDTYRRFFDTLPAAVRRSVTEHWGEPQHDPFHLAASDAFAIPAFECGNVVIGLQPARGYNIDPQSTYHDPDLVPPHGYFAFYAWLRTVRDVHAVIHAGKHGNLEWLPGKALALGESCYPEAVFGPLPHLYPFIVNDPGEGTQAKRRAQAVIVDHLTPPLTRAETYGPLAELELLVDEYFEAAGVDPRRLKMLREEILALAAHVGLDRDCGIEATEDHDTALSKLDNHLCELKEMQIRGGLHVLGRSPEGDALNDLLVSMVRLPRGDTEPADASLMRALAEDLDLGEFDPLSANLGERWRRPRPTALAARSPAPWRTGGDTVERLELLARALIEGAERPEPGWTRTRAVLEFVERDLRPRVVASGPAELDACRHALDARFLPPGPSGAPTRGRLDVLPTGRNFYSVDTRTVPTPAAWKLGWKSAALLLERYRQEHGAWPKRIALSAWGTANMRTGGDDIAQALALMGVKPTWEVASRRVTGFEVLPLDLLDRPRVDVTLRISGFFRDAFPSQIDLFDSAVRAVVALDEPERLNPLAARTHDDAARLVAAGADKATAARRAGFRVFGSKPGAYGAGLQALIDERGWETEADLARAYVAWGGYAYGAGAQGSAEHGLFEARLAGVQAVLHNQDNREHDLLDSDDYYQFEGGLTATVRHLSGERPEVYHSDHSRPETPRIRTLKEEIARVVRARVVNPKWIEAMQRHGYKGAFEMAATLDYLFAFAATTGMVENHHFDAVHAAFLEDEKVREFLERKNPDALREMAERFLEAAERGLWKPRSNSALGTLRAMAGGLPA
ncbi:MAG: cobaltochelatase subunit CobN [Chromatiales bacterium]|nr:cobaltochelatase subunit CobN [Chromatiales bacterium]